MSQIAPCITVETPDEFAATVAKLSPFAERVHIDISDGEFAPRKLLDPEFMSWPEQWTVDVHCMVKHPREYIQKILIHRPHTIVLHAEADEDILPLMKYIRENGSRPGVALLKTTAVSTVAEYIREADHVMIFSGDLGHYGGKASILQLQKVSQIKAINPAVELGWDGGVGVDNAFVLAHGGIDVLNSGGAINNADDPQAAYNELVAALSHEKSIGLG